MKAHKPDVLGEWARENGFENIARFFHPQEVEKRRQQGIRRSNENRRTHDEKYTKQKRR
jgi:hypothetical protein